MPGNRSSIYYPSSQNVFQGRLLRSSLPFIIDFVQLGKEIHTSSMVQSLGRSFLHQSLSSFTRDSWARVFGPWRRSPNSPCINSLRPCESPPGMSCFLSWMIALSRRQEKRFLAVVGIRIMPKTWPMSWAINGCQMRKSLEILTIQHSVVASRVPSPKRNNYTP